MAGTSKFQPFLFYLILLSSCYLFFLPSFLKIHSHRIMAMYLTDSFPNRS